MEGAKSASHLGQESPGTCRNLRETRGSSHPLGTLAYGNRYRGNEIIRAGMISDVPSSDGRGHKKTPRMQIAWRGRLSRGSHPSRAAYVVETIGWVLACQEPSGSFWDSEGASSGDAPLPRFAARCGRSVAVAAGCWPSFWRSPGRFRPRRGTHYEPIMPAPANESRSGVQRRFG